MKIFLNADSRRLHADGRRLSPRENLRLSALDLRKSAFKKVFLALIKLIASCFYLGYVPLIPGTIGSLVGLGIYLLTGQSIEVYSVITIFLLVLGFLVCGKAEVAFGQKDSKRIVLDEAAGMSLTYFAIPFKFWTVSLGFFIFRILDLLKPFPAGSLQRRSGSSGVMWDDIFAGIYSNILLRIVILLFLRYTAKT